MINALNLLWIVPICTVVGAVASAFFIGATQNAKEYEAYQQGLVEGQRMMSKRIDLPLTQTLEELFDRGFESDFNKFKEITGGIIYGTDESGQLHMIFIDNVYELGEYYQNELLSVNNEALYQRPIIKLNIV